jgi:hypothetical protein
MDNLPSDRQDRQPTSVWQVKPWWCQPWSILLTGLALITGSWLGLHRFWVTGIVAIPVCTWMGFFLVIYPQQMASSGLLNAQPPDSAP